MSIASLDSKTPSEKSVASPGPLDRETYGIENWGDGFFAIGDRGTVQVRPDRDPARQVDLHDLVHGLRERGYATPVLLHFGDLLSTVMRAPRRLISGMCMKRFSKMVSVTRLVPSATALRARNCACMSVGKPG